MSEGNGRFARTPETISAEDFAATMAELPAGVSVVTLEGPNGAMGLTVTSLTAYTAEPPSLMLSVAHSSRSCERLVDSERFGVHVLCKDQQHVANAFVRKTDDKFAGLDWWWEDGIPKIAGALAYLRCTREKSFSHWDHSVLIGRIDSVELAQAEPLVYLRRSFDWQLGEPAQGSAA